METVTNELGREMLKIGSFAFWSERAEDSGYMEVWAKWVGDSRFDGEIVFDCEYQCKCEDKDEYAIVTSHIESDLPIRDHAWMLNAVIPELEKYVSEYCDFILNV